MRSITTYISAAAGVALLLGVSAMSHAGTNNILTFQPVDTSTVGLSVSNSGITSDFDVIPTTPSGVTGTSSLFTLTSGAEIGPAVYDPIGGDYEAQFGGGTFSLTGLGGVLLSGTFGGAVIGGTSTANLSLSDVQYTNGLYIDDYISAFGGPAPLSGTANIGGSPTSTDINNSGVGGSLGDFTSQGVTGTFEATPAAAPEASTFVGFAMGACLLLGMVAIGYRRSSAS